MADFIASAPVNSKRAVHHLGIVLTVSASSRRSAQSLWKLQMALEEAGLVFIDLETELGLGVRLKYPSIW